MILQMWPDWQAFNTLAIRIRKGNVTEAIFHIQSTLKHLAPGLPVDWFFLDESMNAAYRSEQRFGEIFMVFSILAIVIACLGLFGLASFTAEQRTKEIGVRKVLGATVSSLVGLLSGDFLILVLIANVIAWPASYYVMSRWLGNFAHKVDIGIGVFVIAAIASVVIAQLTVSVQAARVAMTNPVESLRFE
jgi:putative ABC transport system permease protein